MTLDSSLDKPPKPDIAEPASTAQTQAGVDWFRELLPFEVTVITGSVVLGSDATPSILIGSFTRASGLIEVQDVSATQGELFG